MIDRKKFDDLTEEEKGILGESIGYPDYEDNDDLYEQLNRCWNGVGGPERHIDVVKKL